MSTRTVREIPEIEPRQRLARAVAAARTARAMSAYALARRAGVSRGAVQLIESGTHSPRVETLQRIATALGVSVCTLISGEVA